MLCGYHLNIPIISIYIQPVGHKTRQICYLVQKHNNNNNNNNNNDNNNNSNNNNNNENENDIVLVFNVYNPNNHASFICKNICYANHVFNLS